MIFTFLYLLKREQHISFSKKVCQSPNSHFFQKPQNVRNTQLMVEQRTEEGDILGHGDFGVSDQTRGFFVEE